MQKVLSKSSAAMSIRRLVCWLIGHDNTALAGVVYVCRRCEPDVISYYNSLRSR